LFVMVVNIGEPQHLALEKTHRRVLRISLRI